MINKAALRKVRATLFAAAAICLAMLAATPRAQAGPTYVLSNGYLEGVDDVYFPGPFSFQSNTYGPGAFVDIRFVTGKCSMVFGACTTEAFHPAFASNLDVFDGLSWLFNAFPYRTEPGQFLPCAGGSFCSLFLPDIVNSNGFDYFVFNFSRFGLSDGPGARQANSCFRDPTPCTDPTLTFITLSPAAIPEPPTLFVFGVGLMMIISLWRGRRKILASNAIGSDVKSALLSAAVVTAGATFFGGPASALNFETRLAGCVLITNQEVDPPKTRSVVKLTNGSQYDIPPAATYDIQYSFNGISVGGPDVLKATKSFGVNLPKNASISEPNPFRQLRTTAGQGLNCTAVAHWSNNLKPPVPPLHQ